MSQPEPATLGQRLDRQARAVLARRSEAARRLAARDRPARRWAAPGERRLRVEADVPPAWDDDPSEAFDVASSSGLPMPFPADLGEQLRPVVGPGLDRVVLHDGDADPAADAVARAHDAAAVTVGQQIFLRQGRFRPQSPQGRGLLAHEAVHATQSTRPGTAWRRATAGGRAREEQAAHAIGAVVAREPTLTKNGQHHDAAVTPIGTQPVVAAQRIRIRAVGAAAAPVSRDVLGAVGDVPRADRWSPGTSPANRPDGRWRTLSGPAGGPGFPAVPGLAAAPRSDTTSPSPACAPIAVTVSTSAAATPMAASAAGPADPVPAVPSPGPDLGLTRETMLRELMRQMRTDRERGA